MLLTAIYRKFEAVQIPDFSVQRNDCPSWPVCNDHFGGQNRQTANLHDILEVKIINLVYKYSHYSVPLIHNKTV